MKQPNDELRSHLNPSALRILKKRLASGRITPRVFKDILKQQMVKYFFQTYRHPLLKSWENYWQFAKKDRKESNGAAAQPGSNGPETPHHKRF